MSKLENIEIRVKNAKVKSHTIDKICYYFSEDFTAIQTAKQTGYSRQTINHYYKLIRTNIVKNKISQDYKLIKEVLKEKYIEIKHLNIYNHDIFYIESSNGIIILEDKSILPYKLSMFIKENIENSLINHKKANCARILYNKEKNTHITSGFFRSNNNFEQFLNERLKKFRGINKNNIHLHLSESVFKYNHNKSYIYEEILYNFSKASF